eukprot:m.538415 g.538415  ORF g.538415 m.538415 type:complete len:716 (-) comp22084_c0_seq4:89-2236(-)
MEIEGISSGVTMKNDGDIYISIDDIQSDSTHVAVEEDGPDSMQSTSLEPDHTTDPEALEPDHTTDLEAACKSRKNSDSNEHETTEQFRDSSSVFCDQPTACRSQHNLHLLPDAGPDQSNAGGEAIAVINLSMDASKSQAFSKWFRGLRRDLKLAPGFLRYDRVELPQPKESPSDAKTHVSILVFFNSEDNLRSWLLSEERAYWLNRAKDDMLFEARDIDMHKGYARVAREGCRQRAIRPLPPPKWKLWVIVWFCMYTANLALDVADFMPRVERSGAVEFPVSLLLAVIITVTFITYAYSPVVVETQVFGYNLGMWLKLPHYQPSVPFKSGCLGFLCIAFAGAVNTLNTGFSIFNVAVQDGPTTSELQTTINKLQGRLEGLKQYTSKFRRESLYSMNSETEKIYRNRVRQKRDVTLAGLEMDPDVSVNAKANNGDATQHRSSSKFRRKHRFSVLRKASRRQQHPTEETHSDTEGGDSTDAESEPLTVAINHRVRWECVEDFHDWQGDISREMAKFPGFVSVRLLTPPENADMDNDNLFTTMFRFADIDTLHAWTHAPEREELLTKLQPYLAAEDEVTATRDRHLPDSFSDLLVEQGTKVPNRPPAKWKVVILTVGALFLVSWPLAAHMPKHFDRWGISQKELRMFVQIMMSTFINAFCMVPFFTNLFGHWLTAVRSDFVNYQPWKTLDRGLKWIWWKVLVVAVFFVACLLRGHVSA